MILLYYLLIHLLYAVILAASPFNIKARMWVTGRFGWRKKLKNWNHGGDEVIWIHAASLGEFEQGRPLIEAIKMRSPSRKILLTFFSPSGYEIRKNYPAADLVLYLPLDTPYNARFFISRIRPVATFFIKYEFWYFFLKSLHDRHYPVYLISGIFRPNQVYFSWYGFWPRKTLYFFEHFFLQDEPSSRLLFTINLKNTTVCGDTRFDRVAALVAVSKEIDLAARFSAGKFCLVAGSTWPPDEQILTDLINRAGNNEKFILAPHEISREHLSRITSLLTCSYVFYSDASADNVTDRQVLIIDNIGMLSSLYRYGQLAYIGGGFGAGIHNILEAAAYGIPVIFGPNYQKFREANELIHAGGAFAVRNYSELYQVINSLKPQSSQYHQASTCAGDYVRRNTGATSVIFNHVFP
jgi:3-deoxy-D-manno-octulosonic-acid transferase